MKSNIVAIGNSHMIRIPKRLLEECGVGDEVELEAQRGRIIIRAARHPRAGWEAAFREMAEHGDDILRAPIASATTWDAGAWEW